MTRAAYDTERLFEPLLTPKEAAAAIGVCEDTLRSLVRAGELRFINVGTGKRIYYRFMREDLIAYQDRIAPKPEFLLKEHAKTEGVPWPLQRPPTKTNREGLIYFVGYGRFVKIGYATNFALRLIALQVSTPHPLAVYLTIPGTLEQEKALHRRFAIDRVRGEWFRRSPTIKAWIADADRAV